MKSSGKMKYEKRTFPPPIFLIRMSPPPNALPRDRESSAPPRSSLVQFSSSASIMGSLFQKSGNSIHFYNGVDVDGEIKERERERRSKKDNSDRLFYFAVTYYFLNMKEGSSSLLKEGSSLKGNKGSCKS